MCHAATVAQVLLHTVTIARVFLHAWFMVMWFTCQCIITCIFVTEKMFVTHLPVIYCTPDIGISYYDISALTDWSPKPCHVQHLSFNIYRFCARRKCRLWWTFWSFVSLNERPYLIVRLNLMILFCGFCSWIHGFRPKTMDFEDCGWGQLSKSVIFGQNPQFSAKNCSFLAENCGFHENGGFLQKIYGFWLKTVDFVVS